MHRFDVIRSRVEALDNLWLLDITHFKFSDTMFTTKNPVPVARLILAFVLALMSSPVLAYIGPGAGLSAIGTFIALVVALLVAIIGFVWFPLKRMLKKRNNTETSDSDE